MQQRAEAEAGCYGGARSLLHACVWRLVQAAAAEEEQEEEEEDKNGEREEGKIVLAEAETIYFGCSGKCMQDTGNAKSLEKQATMGLEKAARATARAAAQAAVVERAAARVGQLDCWVHCRLQEDAWYTWPRSSLAL
jgi:hypothetical protein